jgi:hypothetical protein
VLLSTMKELCSEKTVILLAYGKERAAIPKFFELAAEHFDIEQIPDSALEPCHEATPWSTHRHCKNEAYSEDKLDGKLRTDFTIKAESRMKFGVKIQSPKFHFPFGTSN